MTDIDMWIEDFPDDETSPRKQNELLSDIVGIQRVSKRIHLIERIERVEDDPEDNGWRLHYER